MCSSEVTSREAGHSYPNCIGGVNQPWGVAINQKGEVVVAEYGGNCVSVFSPSGEKIRSFGTQGSGPGQLEGQQCSNRQCQRGIF